MSDLKDQLTLDHFNNFDTDYQYSDKQELDYCDLQFLHGLIEPFPDTRWIKNYMYGSVLDYRLMLFPAEEEGKYNYENQYLICLEDHNISDNLLTEYLKSHNHIVKFSIALGLDNERRIVYAIKVVFSQDYLIGHGQKP